MAFLPACLPPYDLGDASDATAADSPVDSGMHPETPAEASLEAGLDGPVVEAGPNGCAGTKGEAMIRFDTNLPPAPASFCIDPYEVTNAEFNMYLLDMSHVFDAPPVCAGEASGQPPQPLPTYNLDAFPVVNITFCDA